MACGEIIYGYGGRVICGSAGTILYDDMEDGHAIITISWVGGADVDILGRFSGSSVFVGFGWEDTIRLDSFIAHWRGDNTDGGPEYIDIYATEGAIEGKSFDIHCNWYEKSGASGPVTVSVSTNGGKTYSVSINASLRLKHRAEVTDPGVRITFGAGGSVSSIEKIN